MRLAQPVLIGAWVLIIANILMSFGSIWMFNRMAPAIERIIERNERSLQACEEMLAALTLASDNRSDAQLDSLRNVFVAALVKAEGNITEQNEPQAISAVRHNFDRAFSGNIRSKNSTVNAIVRLSSINRTAMVNADARARQIGSAGAWGVVFMATGVFLSGLIFLRKMDESMIRPLSDIHTVLTAYEKGDTLRRCTESGVPKDVAVIYRQINGILDRRLN